MAKLTTNCVLCCETIYAAAIGSKKKSDRVLAEWKESCVSSLCESLQVDSLSCKTLHQSKICFCPNCLQLIRDMDFVLKGLERFQTRLRALKRKVKFILLNNAKQLENETNLYAKTVKRIVKSINASKSRKRPFKLISSAASADSDTDVTLHVSTQDNKNSGFTVTSSPQERIRRSSWRYSSLKEEPTFDIENKSEADSEPEEQDNDDPDFNFEYEDLVKTSVPTTQSSNSKIKKKIGRPRTSTKPRPKSKLWCTAPNCSAYFLKDWALQAHIARDHEFNLTPHSCPHCELKFKNRATMFTHCEDSHGVPIVRYPCPNCDKAFRSKCTRKLHITHMHPTGPSRPKCPICTKAFDSETEVKEHQQLHDARRTSTDPFSCVLCNANGVDGMLGLQAHVRKEHDATLFKCSEPGCDRIFKSAHCLKGHIKHKHNVRDRPHLCCPQCGYQSTAPSALKKHMFTHWDKQPFKCARENCAKTFKYQSTLNRHTALEHDMTVEVSKCTLCPRTFKQKGSLISHQAHHSSTRPFLCEHCSLNFKTLQNLKTHYKVHKPQKEAKDVLSLRKPRKSRLPPVLEIPASLPEQTELEAQDLKQYKDSDSDRVTEPASTNFPIMKSDIDTDIDFKDIEPCFQYII